MLSIKDDCVHTTRYLIDIVAKFDLVYHFYYFYPVEHHEYAWHI